MTIEKGGPEVRGETGILRRVIVHAPDQSHELLLPKNVQGKSKDYLLMDDILFVSRAQQEHQILAKILETTAEVFYFRNLLAEVLADERVRKEALKMAGLEGKRGIPEDPVKLADTLLSGQIEGRKLFHPAPNLIFTRDIAAVVGKSIVLSYAATFSEYTINRPREREMALMRMIIKNHALFSNYNIIDVNAGIKKEVSCEGGDIQVVNGRTAMVGVSERTKDKAARQLATHLFGDGFEYVLKVKLPIGRATMHLDTVITMLSPQECVVHEGVIGKNFTVTVMTPSREDEYKGGLLPILADLGVNLQAYSCGGGDPIKATREQWTDGANLMAIAPGVVVGYDRNIATASCLRERGGFEILTADEYLVNPDPYIMGGKKVLILIPSGELSRGRGGPRCLSLPLARD
ncbi:MAG: arginine deiminase family protein [Candidatus Magasanikbacteria bacterium]